MEYLDGCTLGEILEEEKNLPVGWTLDILDQVCSAVQEAHGQGIIHRDLKPDNIWLEPNLRGGYTVKVLDFGIAKLETGQEPEAGHVDGSSAGAGLPDGRRTVADHSGDATLHDSSSPTRVFGAGTGSVRSDQATRVGERATIAADAADTGSEDQTLLFAEKIPDVPKGTRHFDVLDTSERANVHDGIDGTSDLTRVGAVLGTPLYMSPEQCRGDRLDARSDVYSIGVIAYQMLSGSTPFAGDFTSVMEAHRHIPPPPLNARKVRKKLKRVIAAALAKDPQDRPQSAAALANALQSRADGIFGLLRRAAMIYTEHIGKFLLLSAFFYLPQIVLTVALIILSFLKASEAIPQGWANVALGIDAFVLGVTAAFCAYLIIGTITWIVSQSLAAPLRPIRVRPALREARKKWKAFAGTGILSTVLSVLIGIVTCGIGFLVTSVLWMLLAPVVMMENTSGRAALRRSKELVKRSLATSVAAFCILFLIPTVAAGLVSFVVNATAVTVDQTAEKISVVRSGGDTEAAEPASAPPAAVPEKEEEKSISFSIGGGQKVQLNGTGKDMRSRLRDTALETLLQILLLPIQIVATSFTAIIVALLYLKTRQAGGESLQQLLANFEDADQPRKKWQQRVRNRLIQSGRITSKS